MDPKIESYLELNKNINRGYRKLEVWQEVVKLYSFVRKRIDTINFLSYKVGAQISDSALSVSSNIAEDI